MNKFAIFGLFGALLLSSVSFAWVPSSPQQFWMMTMYDHTSCGVDFTATGRGGESLLDYSYDYGDAMGYTPEQLAEFTDLQDELGAHDMQLFTYLMNSQYPQFLSELIATNADMATAKQMYRTTMKEYVHDDYSNLGTVLSDYQSAYSDYQACIAHEVPE